MEKQGIQARNVLVALELIVGMITCIFAHRPFPFFMFGFSFVTWFAAMLMLPLAISFFLEQELSMSLHFILYGIITVYSLYNLLPFLNPSADWLGNMVLAVVATAVMYVLSLSKTDQKVSGKKIAWFIAGIVSAFVLLLLFTIPLVWLTRGLCSGTWSLASKLFRLSFIFVPLIVMATGILLLRRRNASFATGLLFPLVFIFSFFYSEAGFLFAAVFAAAFLGFILYLIRSSVQNLRK